MLRGRRERGSSSALPSTSLLIPPNPAIADPGSSPTARGGILLNPLSKDGTCRTTLSPPPQGRSSSLSSSTSSNRSASLSSQNSRAGYGGGYAASARRSTSLSSAASAGTSSSGGDDRSPSEGDDAASSSTGTAASTSTSSPRLKFAPLPESGRIRRSNSITLGVAARAQMLQGQGMGGGGGGGQRAAPQAPHWQQQVYNSNSSPMWYNGGPMPENVKTFKDLKPGIKKAWGALTRRRSSSNASSASTSSTTSNATGQVGGSGGGSSSEGDISSINEEDEEGQEVETPPSSAAGEGSTTMPNQGKGPESITLTKEGLLVNQPPGSEMNNNETPFEGGQPLRRKDSDAYSDISSNALSDTETDLDSREALITARGLSESPSYTPGMGASGHFYPSRQNHHHHGHGHGDENHEGVRSGEATPKRGHSPTRSPVGDKTTHPQHWTPQLSEYNQHPYTNASGPGNGNGSGSTPGSGANTPRRRMSMGDMSTSFNGIEGQGLHHSNRKGMSVFGFDEAQLKNRLGQMDLNSRRRKPSYYHHHDEEENPREAREGEDVKVNEEEEEVPLPVDSRQVKGAGMEVAV